MSIFNGIKENDVVKIKFKELKEMYSNLDELHVMMDDILHYNMRAILNGGTFIVTNGCHQDHQQKNCISIDNHLDNSGSLDISDDLVETVEVLTDVPSFKNASMGLLITRLDNQLVINGQALKLDDEDTKRYQLKTGKYKGNSAGKSRRNNDLAHFKAFMESWIIDMATEAAMGEDSGEDDT